MHVLEVTYSWPAETFIVRHAEAIASQTPIDLTLGARSPIEPNSASIQAVTAIGYRVRSLPNFDHLSLPHKLVLLLRALNTRHINHRSTVRERVLLSHIERLQPDLIHFHTSSLAVIMAKYANLLGIPYTMSIRGSDIQVNPLTQGEYTEKLCKAAQDASGIHTVIDAFNNQLNMLCGDTPSTTIRTCVPIPEKHPCDYVRPNSIRLISVGRLHWRKAYPDLIRAVAHLPPNYSLDIIGDGSDREHLLYLIDQLDLKDRVRLSGSMPYESFQKQLYAATAYVQSSIAEGFSNALAEAMALGMPVFATPVGGTLEVIEDYRNGIILPTGDPSSMAAKLEMAQDSALMERLGREARLTAQQAFSAERHAKEFEKFYSSIVTKTGSTFDV